MRAIAAAVPPDVAGRAALALRDAVDALVVERALSEDVDAALAAEGGVVLGALESRGTPAAFTGAYMTSSSIPRVSDQSA